MKSLYRISNALYNQQWLILPTVHNSMVNQLESYMEGKIKGISKADLLDDTGEEDNDVETSYKNGNTTVICVDGIIGKHLSSLDTMCGGVDVDTVSAQLKDALEDGNCNQIVMYFNTPGGTVTGVPELAQLISQVNKVKQVFGFADSLCCSAGMWLASQCGTFYCSPSATVGSIGVYSLLLDESRALDKEGITVNAISAGKYKLSGASFRPLTDEEKAMFQADVDKTYSQFKAAVTTNRDISDDVMQGQTFDGEDAVDNNLADGTLNSLEDLLGILSN